MKPPETIRTARLVLRKPTREDAPLMFAAYGQDHEVAHYVTWRPHTCVSDSEAVIGRFLDLWRDGSGFHWMLFQYSGGELM
ncbi:MAG: GNAT family N-acetyltransferase, partial [Verrucomicrobia bacterium]